MDVNSILLMSWAGAIPSGLLVGLGLAYFAGKHDREVFKDDPRRLKEATEETTPYLILAGVLGGFVGLVIAMMIATNGWLQSIWLVIPAAMAGTIMVLALLVFIGTLLTKGCNFVVSLTYAFGAETERRQKPEPEPETTYTIRLIGSLAYCRRIDKKGCRCRCNH